MSIEAPPFIVVDGLFAGRAEPGANLAIRMAKGGVITGRIADGSGNPLTGLYVVAQPQNDRRGISAGGAKYRQHGGLTDDRGVYRLWGLAEGVYLVATRVFPNDDRPDLEIFPAAWDPKERAALRSAAEKAGIRVSLSPRQLLESTVVRLTA